MGALGPGSGGQPSYGKYVHSRPHQTSHVEQLATNRRNYSTANKIVHASCAADIIPTPRSDSLFSALIQDRIDAAFSIRYIPKAGEG